jgi:hypothetical protein
MDDQLKPSSGVAASDADALPCAIGACAGGGCVAAGEALISDGNRFAGFISGTAGDSGAGAAVGA